MAKFKVALVLLIFPVRGESYVPIYNILSFKPKALVNLTCLGGLLGVSLLLVSLGVRRHGIKLTLMPLVLNESYTNSYGNLILLTDNVFYSCFGAVISESCQDIRSLHYLALVAGALLILKVDYATPTTVSVQYGAVKLLSLHQLLSESFLHFISRRCYFWLNNFSCLLFYPSLHFCYLSDLVPLNVDVDSEIGILLAGDSQVHPLMHKELFSTMLLSFKLHELRPLRLGVSHPFLSHIIFTIRLFVVIR
jgi:hypothetical protein